MDKKLGLEHTIRNIINESLGGGVTTDKFKKTANSYFKPFHAEPKKGDSHPDGAGVRATRNAQKEKTSETMNEAEQLDEFNAPPVKIKPKVEIKPPKNLAPPAEAPTVPEPKVTPLEPKVDPEVTPPSAPPAPVAPAKPAAPVAPAPAAPAPAKPAAPSPAAPAAPSVKTAPAPVATPDSVSAPGKASAPGPAPGPQSGNAPGPKPNQPNPPKTKTEEPPKTKTRKFPVIEFPLSVQPLTGAHGGAPVNVYLHTPQERFGESTEADAIRRSIENVARPNSKNKLTKQAELKTKIIDENNRKAAIVRSAIEDKKESSKNPNVDTKPKLKGLELDEKLLPRLGVLGAAGAAGGVGALQEPRNVTNKYKDTSEQEKALKGQKDLFGVPNERYGGVDMVTDFTSMVPGPIGTASALYSAKRSFDRGDYVDTALNLASAIPGVGTVLKGAKFLGKGTVAAGKALQKGGTVASDVATGVQLGDIPYQVNKVSKETGIPKTDLYKDIANTFYSDVKTDVVEPVKKKIKSAIEVYGGPTSSASGKKLSQ